MSTAAQTHVQPKPQPPPAGKAPGYDVARPQGRCHITGNAIEPGTKFMAALRETPVGFERIDVSLDAWGQFERADILAHWQTVMPRPDQKKKLFVDDQVLCELFERLGSVSESAKLNFRFVLGLILMRKRMIIYESSRMEEDREIWSVRFRGRDDKLDLVNPKLGEEQMHEVSRQLSEILNEEL